jgi:ribosome maturation factor RimP
MENNFFESLIGKKIRVVQEDDYVKYGTLKSCDNDFIVLIFSDGRESLISIDFIKSAEIVEGNHER